MKTKTGVNRCNCCKSDTIQEETERYISDLDQYVFYRKCTQCFIIIMRRYECMSEWVIQGTKQGEVYDKQDSKGKTRPDFNW